MEDPSRRRRWSSGKIPLGRGRRHRAGGQSCLLLAILDGSGGPRSRPKKRQQQHGGGDFFPLFFSCSERDQQQRRRGEVVVVRRRRVVEWRGSGGGRQPRSQAGAATGPRIRSPPSDSDPRPRNRARARADRACLLVFIHGRCRGGRGPRDRGPSVSPAGGPPGLDWSSADCGRSKPMLLLPACVAAYRGVGARRVAAGRAKGSSAAAPGRPPGTTGLQPLLCSGAW